ncbi:prepilin-type N-terminal cleavage/methylation domain-containing protein [Elusimicrobium posterum]|uniref:type IV pilin protein n=1 Tax=Elusimicrobium posterum TaxID=3116653 RepID=UPI003C76D98F
MKKQGFTLIELLVVVLIIGILAAIALPQYTKAVEKSRATQGILAAKAVGDAIQRYYLENSNYPPSKAGGVLAEDFFDNLDIDYVMPKDFTFEWHRASEAKNTNFMVIRTDKSYEINYYVTTDQFGAHMTCASYNDKGVQVCKTLGKLHSKSDPHEYYIIN